MVEPLVVVKAEAELAEPELDAVLVVTPLVLVDPLALVEPLTLV